MQVRALLGERSILDDLIPKARAIASDACAPVLAWVADWAEAVQHAASGDEARAVSAATGAADALEQHGEPYTAARLLADLLPFLSGGDPRVELAERTAARLDQMGAITSAKQLPAR